MFSTQQRLKIYDPLPNMKMNFISIVTFSFVDECVVDYQQTWRKGSFGLPACKMYFGHI